MYVVAFGPAASKPRQPLGRDEPLPADCAILVVPANARRPPAARAAATGQAAVWTPLTLALDAGTTAIAPVVLVLYFTGVIHGT